MDGTEEEGLLNSKGVTGYPTLKLYRKGELVPYTGRGGCCSFFNTCNGEMLRQTDRFYANYRMTLILLYFKTTM